jgi:hypothetical protein
MFLLKKSAFLFILLLSLTASAQYGEVGIFLGGSRYKGELSPHLFSTKFIHPAAGIFYRKNMTRHWSWKLEFNYGRVSGADADLDTPYELNRNLSFYSDIFEFTPGFEFNFFPFETGNDRYRATPYLFSGLTVFYFNPKTEIEGEKIKLHDIGTEGQGLPGRDDPYHRVAMAFPIGGGIKINTGNVSIAFHVSARKTYTDYVDDVSTTYPSYYAMLATKGELGAYLSDPGLLRDSLDTPMPEGKQRGDPAFNDWYVFGGVNIFIRLTNFQKEFCKPFKRKRFK